VISQRFLDPLYGPISVDDSIMPLVFSPEFQRLRYVRLCNINSLFLTGASEPKRFEHCLGVYHLARDWAERRAVSPRDRAVLCSAALLHDLQTGPFGHSFQYVMEDNPFEVRFEHSNLAAGVQKRFLQLTQAGANFAGRPFTTPELLGELSTDVFAAIEGQGTYGPLISGTLDFDNLDNVVRLAFHMGLCDDKLRSLPLALAPLLDVHDGSLAATSEAHSLFESWFDLRRRLYEYLLLDRGEYSAKAMLTLAVELAAEANLLGPADWRLTDEELLSELDQRSIGEHQFISQIIKRLRAGDLFESIGVWKSSTTASYGQLSEAHRKRHLEHQITTEIGRGAGPRLRVSVHYILDRKKTCRSLSYFDVNRREHRTVGYDSDVLLIGVFVTNSRVTQLTDQERTRVSQCVLRVLGNAGFANVRPAEEPLAEFSEEVGLFVA
jgi:uncharacterized protein